jgi:hypothetical protein
MQQDYVTPRTKRSLTCTVKDDCADFGIGGVGLKRAGYSNAHLFRQRI